MWLKFVLVLFLAVTSGQSKDEPCQPDAPLDCYNVYCIHAKQLTHPYGMIQTCHLDPANLLERSVKLQEKIRQKFGSTYSKLAPPEAICFCGAPVSGLPEWNLAFFERSQLENKNPDM